MQTPPDRTISRTIAVFAFLTTRVASVRINFNFFPVRPTGDSQSQTWPTLAVILGADDIGLVEHFGLVKHDDNGTMLRHMTVDIGVLGCDDVWTRKWVPRKIIIRNFIPSELQTLYRCAIISVGT
jgi:hypothetical protein